MDRSILNGWCWFLVKAGWILSNITVHAYLMKSFYSGVSRWKHTKESADHAVFSYNLSMVTELLTMTPFQQTLGFRYQHVADRHHEKVHLCVNIQEVVFTYLLTVSNNVYIQNNYCKSYCAEVHRAHTEGLRGDVEFFKTSLDRNLMHERIYFENHVARFLKHPSQIGRTGRVDKSTSSPIAGWNLPPVSSLSLRSCFKSSNSINN